MSLASSSSAPLRPTQANVQSIGYLALSCTGKRLTLEVRHSAAGHYIGTADADGPVSRESVEYFRSYKAASDALASGRWRQRTHP